MCSRFQEGTILLHFCLFENNNSMIKPWIVCLKESLSVCLKAQSWLGFCYLWRGLVLLVSNYTVCSSVAWLQWNLTFPLESAWMQNKPALESNVSASFMQLILVQLFMSFADVSRTQPNHKRNK